jgi:hypothetical protein
LDFGIICKKVVEEDSSVSDTQYDDDGGSNVPSSSVLTSVTPQTNNILGYQFTKDILIIII